jgi:phage terminase small subunit
MLTPKQAQFADLIAGGLNQTQAYRGAYNAQGMNSDTVKVEACKLAKHSGVVRTVKALRKGCPSTKRVVADLHDEWVRMRLMDLAESPYATSSIKLSALEFLGKNLGMF